MTGKDSRPWSTGHENAGNDASAETTGSRARKPEPGRRDEDYDPEAEALRQFAALGTLWGPARSGKRPAKAGTRRPEPNSTPEADSSRARGPTTTHGLHPSNVDNVDKVDAIRLAAETWLASHPIRANAKSRARYRKVADRMEATGKGPEVSTNASTFQGRKAAAFLRIAEELERWLDEGGDPDHAESLLKHAAELATLTWSAVKPAKPTTRRSKVNLSDMPPGWKERMFERATNRLRLPVVLLEIGGMRPEEIGRPAGVEITLLTSDKDVRFRISFQGAKVGDGHGIAAGHPTGWQWRELVIEATGERAEWLADAVSASGGTLLYRTNSERLKDSVRSLAKRIWPRRKAENRPSAYSYRHAFSSAQKAAGTDAATLAVAMGHRAERTQGGYGRPSRTVPPDVLLVSARAVDARPGDAPRPDRRSRLRPKP